MSQHEVTAGLLNLRAGPGPDHPAITQLPRGTVIAPDLVTSNGDWLHVRVPGTTGLSGWVSARYLGCRHEGACGLPTDPSWLTVAMKELGVAEITGDSHESRILEYFGATNLKATDDETSWCSAFANWCLQEAGLVGTGSPAARSWLSWGTELPTPRRGCVAVFSRPGASWMGHVGFFLADLGGKVQVLGGNQGDKVAVEVYGVERLIGYRWPTSP